MRPVVRFVALRALLSVAATMVAGCGGPEFVVGNGTSEDAGGHAEASTPNDGEAPSDGQAPQDGSGGPDGTAPGDAGDAGGGAKDAAGGPDSAPPPADAGDAGPIAFTTCANATDPNILFCSDFDEQTKAPWNWQVPLVSTSGNNPKGTDTDDTTDFLSSPNGFAAVTKELILTDPATFAGLQQQFPSAAKHIDYSFQAYVKEIDQGDLATASSFSVASILVGAASTDALTLALNVSKNGITLVQSFPGSDGGPQEQTTPVGGSFGTNQWVHVEMLLDRSGAPWNLTIVMNGVVELSTPTIAMPPATQGNAELEVNLGLLYVIPPCGPNAITFDNVVVRGY